MSTLSVDPARSLTADVARLAVKPAAKPAPPDDRPVAARRGAPAPSPVPEWVRKIERTIEANRRLETHFMDDQKIVAFRSDLGPRCLSNFASLDVPIEWEGFLFPATEQAYQAISYVDP